MKILILGKGWLGNRLKGYFGDDATISNLRLLDMQVEDILGYDAVINTAAKTDIDWCEKNKLQTFKDNVIGALHVANLCKDRMRYVFISSACIFESDHIGDLKTEESVPNPKCFYALSKWMAEELIREANPDALILRIRLPLSEIPHRRNTITKILTYKELNTNQESATIVEDFLPAVKDLLIKGWSGVFHLVNAGTISPHEIADVFNHPHVVVSKEYQDERMKKEGKAKRVTTYVGTTRYFLLPNVRERMKSLKENYCAYKNL